jgi:hypothetical protein
MRRAAAALAVTAAAVALPVGAVPATSPTLVARVILAAPEPQCTTTCVTPATRVRLVLAHGTRSVLGRTDPKGGLRLSLTPGTWTVRSPDGASVSPSRVVIARGTVTRVTLRYRPAP